MITKGIFYHIQKEVESKPHWLPGDHYEINPNKTNNFHKDLLSGIGDLRIDKNNNQVGLVNYFGSLTDKEIEDSSKLFNISYDLNSNLRQYIKWIQETIFENVRLKINSSIPSRKSCVWLCNYDQIENWIEIIGNKKSRFKQPEVKILRVSVDGYAHEVDAKFIDADTYKIEDFESKAEKYWKGERQSDKEIEVLFYGKLTVIDRYNSFNDIESK